MPKASDAVIIATAPSSTRSNTGCGYSPTKKTPAISSVSAPYSNQGVGKRVGSSGLALTV